MRRRHTDKGYERELNEVRQRLLLMAGRVEDLVEKSIQAFVRHDSLAAEQAIQLDQAINQDEVDIDALCFQIFSRRQPA